MARAQGAQAKAKEDTVYLALGGTLETDLGQQLTDLTVSGAGAFEAPSARANLPTVRTISARWTATAAEAGVVLVICGNSAQTDLVWGLATNGAGKICGYINANVGVITATLATAAKDYSIEWSTRVNPDTTGASDALISELWIYNHTDGTTDDVIQTTHAVSAAATGPYNLSAGGFYNGVALTNVPTNAPTEARVSVAHHPAAEAAEDWVGARVAYAGTADDGPVEPTGPIPSSSGLGDESQFAGRHPWGYAAAHALGTRQRSWSPPLSDVDNDDEAMPPAQQVHWEASAPGDPRYSLDLSRPRWLQVPPSATHVRVRVHVRAWLANEGDPVPTHFRVYAWNRPPTLAAINAQNSPSLASFFGEGVIEVDDMDGPGEWLDLGPVLLPRFEIAIPGWEGSVWLTLAYAIDPEGLVGNDADARFDVDGVQAVPAVADIPWHIIEL